MNGEKVNAVRFEGEQAILAERVTVNKSSGTVNPQDLCCEHIAAR